MGTVNGILYALAPPSSQAMVVKPYVRMLASVSRCRSGLRWSSPLTLPAIPSSPEAG